MTLFRLILLVILFLPFSGLRAQVPARENNSVNRPLIRDTTVAMKKKISDQYDSLINNCKSQVIVLSYNISSSNKQVDGLKKQIKQEEADYAAWEKNAGRSLSKEQFAFQSQQKYTAHQEKIRGYNNQIDGLNASISNKQQQIKELQSQISKLEKDKAVSLGKL